jgi:hypothetical protein
VTPLQLLTMALLFNIMQHLLKDPVANLIAFG